MSKRDRRGAARVRAVVTGAGPIGLLSALMGVQRGLEVHVLDRVTEGPKPELTRDLGATYHTGSVEEACEGADIVNECTGAAQLVFDAMRSTAPGGITCLTGVSSGGRALEVDYEAAAASLAKADPAWLSRLITRRVPLERWQEALSRTPLDVKPVIDLAA